MAFLGFHRGSAKSNINSKPASAYEKVYHDAIITGFWSITAVLKNLDPVKRTPILCGGLPGLQFSYLPSTQLAPTWSFMLL